MFKSMYMMWPIAILLISALIIIRKYLGQNEYDSPSLPFLQCQSCNLLCFSAIINIPFNQNDYLLF